MAVQETPGQFDSPPATDVAQTTPAEKKVAVLTTKAKADVVVARSAPEKTQSFLEKLISDAIALTGNSTHLTSFIETLRMYVMAMAPGIVITPADGANYNRSLWMALSYVLEHAPAGEFRAIWSVFLGYVQEHSTKCFDPRYAYRFESHYFNSEQCRALHSLINLAMLTYDSKTRAEGLKQVSLEKTLLNGSFSETARQRLISFYRT